MLSIIPLSKLILHVTDKDMILLVNNNHPHNYNNDIYNAVYRNPITSHNSVLGILIKMIHAWLQQGTNSFQILRDIFTCPVYN